METGDICLLSFTGAKMRLILLAIELSREMR